MKSTRLTYLQKVQDGFLFREDFESDAFVNNSTWQSMQGIIQHTSAQHVAGQFALQLAGLQDDSGFAPVIRRSVTGLGMTILNDWLYTVWFYDDATNTTSPGGFIKLLLADGKFLQVGVRNGVSTTHYVCNALATFTEDSFAATSVARTTGWHKLQIHHQNYMPGHTYEILVDDTLVRDISFALGGSVPSAIYVQGAKVGEVGDSFGYFDEVRLQSSKYMTLINVNQRRINIIGIGSVDSNNTTYRPVPAVLPADNAYTIQISQNALAYTKLDLYWQNVNFNGGDIYTLNQVDFGRRASDFPADMPGTLGSTNRSANGSSETITVGMLERFSFTMRTLKGDTWMQYAQDFFDFARKGFPFVFALDSSDTVFTLLSASTDMVNSPTEVVVSGTLSVGAGNVVAHGMYILEDAARTKRQVVTVATFSNSTGQVFFYERLKYNFQAGDILRSVFFYPLMELADPKSMGLRNASIRTLKRDWSFNLQEFVP